MNGIDFLDYEDAESYDDSDESYDDSYEDGYEDASPAKRRRAVPIARGRGYTVQRMARGYVTQTQLQAGLSRVGADIRRNSAAIRTVGRRVDASNSKQEKNVSRLRSDVKRSSMMAMMMPMLIRPKVVSVPADVKVPDANGNLVVAIPKDTKLQTESSDTMTMLLPLLLLSGGLGGGGDDGKGGDNTMMMLLMVMMMPRQ